MITKITLWLEKGKPTKVRATKHEDFYMEDLSQLFEQPNERKGAEHVARQKKNCTSPKK